MNPTRLALGVAAVVALFVAFGQPSDTIPTPATAPNTVIVTLPPSTTSTRPSPGLSTASFTGVLSSKHFTVTTGPAKRCTAPKSRRTGGSTRNAPETSLL